MTVREILEKYLLGNDYNCLINPHSECWCKVGKLFFCGQDPSRCKPAYKINLYDSNIHIDRNNYLKNQEHHNVREATENQSGNR